MKPTGTLLAAFPPSYVFGTTLTEGEVRIALSTANAVTYNYSGVEASMHCSYYDAAGRQATVNCTAGNAAACAQPGELCMHAPPERQCHIDSPQMHAQVTVSKWYFQMIPDSYALARKLQRHQQEPG
jgi:hypothetical protein